MENNDFNYICDYDKLKEKEGQRFIVDDEDIAVFKVNGEVYAVDNVCPHQHAAVIYDGFIEEGCVVCPSHGWAFDLETGKLGATNTKLKKHEVKVEDGKVYVKAKKTVWNW